VTAIGRTLMCEQAGPKELVRDVQMAEDAGFEFAVISDHYFPWVEPWGTRPTLGLSWARQLKPPLGSSS
jgi:alkanesulfonate monooxygenase SsuD/methylene tetrahydromethanopterin reductase-like flavin-dependent oxidoreductase (luciferase family)